MCHWSIASSSSECVKFGSSSRFLFHLLICLPNDGIIYDLLGTTMGRTMSLVCLLNASILYSGNVVHIISYHVMCTCVLLTVRAMSCNVMLFI
jgi:hypothetical protein